MSIFIIMAAATICLSIEAGIERFIAWLELPRFSRGGARRIR